MTKNIIFDMGNVLMRFDPPYFLAKLGISGEDADLLTRNVFRSVEWVMTDRGFLREERALFRMCQRLPQRLHAAAEQLVLHWDEPILPMPGMEPLLRDLKAAGYGLYLLSNAGFRQPTYWPRIPGSQFFGGTYISAEHGLMKPQVEIYRDMLQTFDLDPMECLFIDDAPANIEGASLCDIPGIVFHGSAALLRQELQDLHIL